LVLVACVVFGSACAMPEEPTLPKAARRRDILLPIETESVAGRVPDHATLATVLSASRIRADLVPAVVSLAQGVFNTRRLKAGREFRVVRTLDGLVRTFECEIDDDRYLRVRGPSDRRPEELTVELVPYAKETARASVQGAISPAAPSLFAAMEQIGEGPELSIALADIFAGEIDFHTELQPGDTFTLTFDKVYREGTFLSYGAISGAEFSNAGRVLRAVLYTVPGGRPEYYDPQGRSLKRVFLSSPLRFAAPISSGFSRARLHPILRVVRAHLGVDYRAPAGSPVIAVANGTVISAGRSGGAGQLIHIRHASGYETFYMHLSSIAVRAGQHVEQGQVVGRVGTTGLSTGPHLDYRVWKDGRPINPLTLRRSLPPGEPVPARFLAQFEAERDRALSLLLHPAQAVPTQPLSVVAPAAQPGRPQL
jgi:murein DD-endopeptidase MepM/ murein hydrolase activator NlpD